MALVFRAKSRTDCAISCDLADTADLFRYDKKVIGLWLVI